MRQRFGCDLQGTFPDAGPGECHLQPSAVPYARLKKVARTTNRSNRRGPSAAAVEGSRPAPWPGSVASASRGVAQASSVDREQPMSGGSAYDLKGVNRWKPLYSY
jgi:hypothetical protein